MEPISTITAQEEGYEDPPAAGWESGSSCLMDSADELENWQHRLSEHHRGRNVCPTKSLRWVNSQLRTIPVYDGSTDPEPFIVQFSDQIPDLQKMEALESAFRATAVRWWMSHKK